MSSDDVQCPYCEEWFDVDPCEKEQEQWYEDECPHCHKGVFVMVEYYPSYSIEPAPCLNGWEHSWFEVQSSFHGKYKECNCGATEGKMSDKEAWAKQEKEMSEYKLKKEIDVKEKE